MTVCLFVASHQTLISLPFASTKYYVSDRLSNSLSDGLSNSISNGLSDNGSFGISVSIVIVPLARASLMIRYSRKCQHPRVVSHLTGLILRKWRMNVLRVHCLRLLLYVLIMWLLNSSQNHEPWNPETSCSGWPTWTAHRSSHQEADAPTCPRDHPWVRETSSLFLYIFFEKLISLFRFPAIYDITAIFSKVRVILSSHILDAILCWNVTQFSLLTLQSSKSKAAKFSKQAKVFTVKSVKSEKSKSGKSGDNSGKGGKALFHKSGKGYGWWSASGAVSYLNSGLDYTPIGLERKSSTPVMQGTGWWVAIVTVVTCAGTLLFWEVCREAVFPAIGQTCEAAGLLRNVV